MMTKMDEKSVKNKKKFTVQRTYTIKTFLTLKSIKFVRFFLSQ